jgi:equilibrative nucleoside transporter 1/2/3
MRDSRLPIVFNNDSLPILFMILFAFSNGYIGSQCMMMGPSMVSVKDAPVAGSIMIFALTAGLLAGACFSFVTIYISQGSFS